VDDQAGEQRPAINSTRIMIGGTRVNASEP
jgi:hypothetical protein